MKKLQKLFLVLALAVAFFKPCAVCEALKANGTAEEYAEHIQEAHNGVDPLDIDFPEED